MATTLRQIARPGLGRATDKRVTQDYLSARGLPGNPFDPAQDVDWVDQINGALADVQAQIGATQQQSGTRAQRLALNTSALLAPTPWFETDHLITLTFWPGTGWRGPNGENIDNPPPPPPPTVDPTSF